MPNSSLENAVLVKQFTYALPSKQDLVMHAQGQGEAAVLSYSDALKMQTKFSIAHFFVRHDLVLPDRSIFPDMLAKSTAINVLYQNFFELVKNSMDELASTLNIEIYQNAKHEVEVVISDTQPGLGFLKETGTLQAYFAGGKTQVNYQADIVDKHEKVTTTKVRGESLGGKGKGLSFMNSALVANGGKLNLEYQKDSPAIIRLISKMHLITPLVVEEMTEEEFELSVNLSRFSLSRAALSLSRPDSVLENESPFLNVQLDMQEQQEGSQNSSSVFFSPQGSGLDSPVDFSLDLSLDVGCSSICTTPVGRSLSQANSHVVSPFSNSSMQVNSCVASPTSNMEENAKSRTPSLPRSRSGIFTRLPTTPVNYPVRMSASQTPKASANQSKYNVSMGRKPGR